MDVNTIVVLSGVIVSVLTAVLVSCRKNFRKFNCFGLSCIEFRNSQNNTPEPSETGEPTHSQVVESSQERSINNYVSSLPCAVPNQFHVVNLPNIPTPKPVPISTPHQSPNNFVFTLTNEGWIIAEGTQNP